MGKGGSGKAKQKNSGKAVTASSADDDALLEAAIVEASIARAAAVVKAEEAKAKEAAMAAVKIAQAKFKPGATKPAGEILTMQQTLAKLDRIIVFTLVRVLDDGSKDACPFKGELQFYVDAGDAQADLAALQKENPEAKLGIGHAPLGRAFALTQGLMGLKADAPSRLQFPRSACTAEGDGGVPKELREKMTAAGPFPLFYSDKLGNPSFTPVFFSRSDLSDFWTTSGAPAELKPEDHTTVTDLRILVARTLQEPGSWQPLHYVPAKASAALAKEVTDRAAVDDELAEGFTKGAQRLKQEMKKLAVESGDEPPALS